MNGGGRKHVTDYNKEFEYEEVGYCKPDGDDNQASTEYYQMWTGWKMDAYDTYSHDSSVCAANYWEVRRGAKKSSLDSTGEIVALTWKISMKLNVSMA